ncbi:MAG TPA: SMC-Scp complex subunit ScpB [Kiritimatiellae bacterium]|nr:SMC-Scp complex subunit ScpB [Kiritimatiellia bacterium]
MEAADAPARPDLKAIVGALLLAHGRALTAERIREALIRAAEASGQDPPHFSTAQIAEAVSEVRSALEAAAVGIEVVEVAHGWRMQTRGDCGRWVRALLVKAERPRLSRPALETLAIIAYRQPCTRAEIEAVRGVSVDHVLRSLLEMELIRIAGRSRLPGRPLFFATTPKFLEHFGLRSLEELPAAAELRRRDSEADGWHPPAPGEKVEAQERKAEDEQ